MCVIGFAIAPSHAPSVSVMPVCVGQADVSFVLWFHAYCFNSLGFLCLWLIYCTHYYCCRHLMGKTGSSFAQGITLQSQARHLHCQLLILKDKVRSYAAYSLPCLFDRVVRPLLLTEGYARSEGITPIPNPASAFSVLGKDWFNSLSECLNWNKREIQKTSSQSNGPMPHL